MKALISVLTSCLVSFSVASSASDNIPKTTNIGVEVAGNDYVGDWVGLKAFDSRGLNIEGLTNVFDEQPIDKINKEKLSSAADFLTEGHKRLLELNPTHYLPVYNSLRTVEFPDKVVRDLSNDPKSTVFPFLVPSEGKHYIVNHMNRFRGGESFSREHSQVAITERGRFRTDFKDEILFRPDFANNLRGYYRQTVTSGKYAGTILLLHEPFDSSISNRVSWLITPRDTNPKKEEVTGDHPAPFTFGLRTRDSYDMYNGSDDTYSYKLLGKETKLIPYNSVKFLKKGPLDRFFMQDHLNPEYTRYEYHRVWVVEATLNEGKKNLYDKRVFYIDEDSYMIVAVDYYHDGRLWRLGEGHMVFTPHNQVAFHAAEVVYDFDEKDYVVTSLIADTEGFDHSFSKPASYFSPSDLMKR